tara:strand:+ start:343 stop:798 length:456 start_codon:yes stop_codon:yes gene_type:complete
MKILVSACLLGSNVRWNGANKRCEIIMNWADEIGAEIVPVCPENDLYGTPRGPIRLIQIDEKIEYNLGGRDVYEELKLRVDSIYEENKDAVGFIGIYGSPTCAISVGVKNKGGFTRGLMHANPPVPTTEIAHFRNENSRNAFLKKIINKDR